MARLSLQGPSGSGRHWLADTEQRHTRERIRRGVRVSPRMSRRLGSAPAVIRSLMHSFRPSLFPRSFSVAAQCSGAAPEKPLTAFTLAPAFTRTFATSMLPHRQATCSAVCPTPFAELQKTASQPRMLMLFYFMTRIECPSHHEEVLSGSTITQQHRIRAFTGIGN